MKLTTYIQATNKPTHTHIQHTHIQHTHKHTSNTHPKMVFDITSWYTRSNEPTDSDRLSCVSHSWGITLRDAAELILNMVPVQSDAPPEEIEMDNLSEGSEESDWVMVEVTDTQPSTLTAIVEVDPVSDDEDDWDNIPDLEDFDYGELESVPSGARVTTEEESDGEEDWDNVPELDDFDYSLV